MRKIPDLPINIPNITSSYLDKDNIQGKNIENMIGSIELPLGIAGPINIPEFGNFLIPLATTEGALVASVNRGLKALNQSDMSAVVEYVGMTRGPVFETDSLKSAKSIANSIKSEYFDELARLASNSSSHILLKKIQTQVLGNHLYIRFRFDTDEAMGMNMVTYATETLTSFLSKTFSIKELALSSNFCVDKKVALSNWVFGRGHQVWIEATLSKKTVESVLKTKISSLQSVYDAKIIFGSILAGASSYNAQFANVIAAFFAATGQDLGHVGECSQGILQVRSGKDSLYASVFLPNINIGSVGGGTSLPSQSEAINIVLAGKTDKTKKDSSILVVSLGAAILAGELSLLAALASSDLSASHKSLTGKNAV